MSSPEYGSIEKVIVSSTAEAADIVKVGLKPLGENVVDLFVSALTHTTSRHKKARRVMVPLFGMMESGKMSRERLQKKSGRAMV